MPELAEVETIRSQLTQFLPLKIVKIFTSSHIASFTKKIKTISNSSSNHSIKKNLEFDLEKSSIIEINRHGKFLIFKFNNDKYLLSHLGMSGHWQITQNTQNKKNLQQYFKHAHLSLIGSKTSFIYIDPRRFGMMSIMNKEELKCKLNSLGPDLTSKDMNKKHIKSATISYPNRSIKKLLLDQSLFAGMGNYLANEVCAHSKILPTRLAKNINDQEITSLNLAIKKVVKAAIRSKGTTLSKGGYKNAAGEFGQGINNLVVFYQDICGMCGITKVTKTYLDGRGTYYCPKCQH